MKLKVARDDALCSMQTYAYRRYPGIMIRDAWCPQPQTTAVLTALASTQIICLLNETKRTITFVSWREARKSLQALLPGRSR